MIDHFLSNISAKYYKNSSMLSRVIAKTSGMFFLRHSVVCCIAGLWHSTTIYLSPFTLVFCCFLTSAYFANDIKSLIRCSLLLNRSFCLMWTFLCRTKLSHNFWLCCHCDWHVWLHYQWFRSADAYVMCRMVVFNRSDVCVLLGRC